MSFVIVPFTCERFQRNFRFFSPQPGNVTSQATGCLFSVKVRREQLEAAKNAITFPRLQVNYSTSLTIKMVFWSTSAVTLGLKNQGCLERVFYDVMSYS